MQSDQLLFYKDIKNGVILHNMCELVENLHDDTLEQSYLEELFYSVVSDLYKVAAENGFEGNLWHAYLTEILVYNENPYTMACELKGTVEGTLHDAILHDLRIFMDFFAYDMSEVENVIGSTKDMTLISDFHGTGHEAIKYNRFIAKEISELAKRLANIDDVIAFRDELDKFYGKYGVGVFGLHKAFRVEHTDMGLQVNPIFNIAVTSLEDIVGYDIPKKKIVDNTEAFLAGKKANNCLIYGDAGTGKSSSIRAIINQYYGQGLRMIEVYKHQYRELNDLIDRLKTRNYRFIIYMDDLSFEEFETEYKYLKAVIEGGLESKPDNVLIYATSNRRHLVKESFSDKNNGDEDMHKNETVQEKLSLFARFGVSVFFGRPDKKEYNHIVKTLAERYNLNISEEELALEANKWELSHGGLSGRTARQFIDYLRGKF